jgi:hypothetical protein
MIVGVGAGRDQSRKWAAGNLYASCGSGTDILCGEVAGDPRG